MTKVNVLAALLLLTFLVVPATSQSAEGAAREAIAKGNLLVAHGSYELALREYERIGPNSTDLYSVALYNIGVCYYELWRTADAIDYYQRAIKQRNGLYPQASYALGVALEDEGRSSEAKSAYEQALVATRGNYARADYRLGLIAANSGDTETAAALFRKALHRPGEHLIASHNNLGVMLARMRRLKEAETEFAVALRLSNNEFRDAAHNLALCQRLLSGADEMDFASLRVTRIFIVD
ncbi:MAG TPA: tetratricopeptide repeat protein [Pyrinomonadaceae bacterium]|nr:tetratricopeptide repeat protein [Pyrinomonadaceae bacterium]